MNVDHLNKRIGGITAGRSHNASMLGSLSYPGYMGRKESKF